MQAAAETCKRQTSWYDGWFFAHCVDPMSENALHLNRRVKELVADKSVILDIGCGTGSLAFALAQNCSRITGIDISPRMIAWARKHNQYPQVAFVLSGSNSLPADILSQTFDYCVLKMVLHEMPEATRQDLIREAHSIARNLIILDWVAPQPAGINGIMTWFFEWMAPQEHFANFKQWQEQGGLDGFMERCHLRAAHEQLFENKAGKIVSVCC